MFIGVVKRYDGTKGEGFIARDEGPDVFVHYKTVKEAGLKSLDVGQKVAFDLKQGKTGPVADKLRVL